MVGKKPLGRTTAGINLESEKASAFILTRDHLRGDPDRFIKFVTEIVPLLSANENFPVRRPSRATNLIEDRSE